MRNNTNCNLFLFIEFREFENQVCQDVAVGRKIPVTNRGNLQLMMSQTAKCSFYCINFLLFVSLFKF